MMPRRANTGLTPEERLRFHQQHSGPVMESCMIGWKRSWQNGRRSRTRAGQGDHVSAAALEAVDAVSAGGRGPTGQQSGRKSFEAGGSCTERTALFYRTLNGAQVGDLFMSLIHTCQLCGANSFDYLTELQRHARELAAKPGGVDAVELPRARWRTHAAYMMNLAWPKRIHSGRTERTC